MSWLGGAWEKEWMSGPLSGDVRAVQLFLKADLDEQKLATLTYLGLRSEKISIVLTS